MKFRTEIEYPAVPAFTIGHDTPILMLGSCFTDNIGQMLDIDGFDVMHNPLGTLYNPASILRLLQIAEGLSKPDYIEYQGLWHCMNLPTKYTHSDLDDLKQMVEADFGNLKKFFDKAEVVIVTLGTSYVFSLVDNSISSIVGNCHKLPAAMFNRFMLNREDTTEYLREISKMCGNRHVIFTVSPIRHTADTLHGNQLSKANLLLSIDDVISDSEAANRPMYFPAYEIMMDDLRDYRFYAADMKHPSQVAVEYIYDTFAKYFFTPATTAKALECRKAYRQTMHKPIHSNAITDK